MRFIIREQEYEKLVAAGRLGYRSATGETGAVEQWRLTQAVDGYRVMRVDLDRRETPDASSTLFHLLLNAQGGPERLKVRHFSQGRDVDADVLLAEALVTVRHTFNGETTQEVLTLPAGFGLLFPSTVGLALFVHHNQARPLARAITLDEQRNYVPMDTAVEIKPLIKEEMRVTGQLLTVRPYLIRSRQKEAKIWLDDDGLPMRMVDQDHGQIVEERYMRHDQATNDKP